MTRSALIICDLHGRSHRYRLSLHLLAALLEKRGLLAEVQDIASSSPRVLLDGCTQDGLVGPPGGDLEHHEERCQAVADSLRQMAPRASTLDLVVVASACATTIEGVARWISRTGSNATIALLFDHGDSITLGAGTSLAGLLAWSLRSLVRVTKRRPVLLATHEDLSLTLQRLTGQTCMTVAPVSQHIEADGPATERSTRGGIALLSDASDERSAFAVPEIATELLRDPSLRLSLAEADVKRSYALRRLQEDGKVSSVRDGRFDVIPSAAIMVLPRGPYRQRTSRRFSALVGSGVPMIVPSDTWMAERVRRGDAAGLCFEQDTTASVLAATRIMLRNLSSWQAVAAVLAPVWLERTSMQRLADALVGLAETAASG